MLKTIEFQDHNQLYITDEPDTLRELLDEGLYAIPEYTNENISLSWSHTDYAVTNLKELLTPDEVNDVPTSAGDSENISLYDKDILVEGVDFIPDSIIKIYQRLAKLPWHILDTKNLSLREMTVEDVDIFYSIYDNEALRFVEPLFSNPLDEKIYTQNYIKDIYGFYGYGLWTVIDKSTGNVIGRAGISNRDGFDIPELGFILAGEYRGRGLGYEICRAILDYAKKELGFTVIQALVLPNNVISINLLKKLGFMDTGDMYDEYEVFECTM